MTTTATRNSAHAVFDRSQIPSALAPAETGQPAGVQKAGAGTSLLRLSAGSARHVARYATSRTIVLIVRAEMNVLKTATTPAATAVTMMAAAGVRNRGCVCESTRGSSPLSAIAKGSRAVANTIAFRMPPIDTRAAAAITTAPEIGRAHV